MPDKKDMGHLKHAVDEYAHPVNAVDPRLSHMLELQRDLELLIQTVKGRRMTVCVYKDPAEGFTDKEADEFILCNVTAIEDELSEMRDLLNWKHWKEPGYNMPLDRFNIAMEGIDILHFLLNIFNALGYDANTLFAMYRAKREENMRRQRGEGPHGKEYSSKSKST